MPYDQNHIPNDTFFEPGLTSEKDIKDYTVLFFIHYLSEGEFKYPENCVSALCDFLSHKPVLSESEYAQKFNLNLHHASACHDSCFLKYLHRHQSLDSSLGDLNCLYSTYNANDILDWTNPQTTSLLSPQIKVSPSVALMTLLDKAIYKNDLSNEGVASLFDCLFSTDHHQHHSAYYESEKKNYDNSEKVAHHIEEMLNRHHDLDNEAEIFNFLRPDAILNSFVEHGLYLNETDHSGNNYLMTLALGYQNPVLIVYLAQNYGLNLFHKNNEGLSAYDVITQSLSIDKMVMAQHFKSDYQLVFNFNEDPTDSHDTLFEKDYLSDILSVKTFLSNLSLNPVAYEERNNFSHLNASLHQHPLQSSYERAVQQTKTFEAVGTKTFHTLHSKISNYHAINETISGLEQTVKNAKKIKKLVDLADNSNVFDITSKITNDDDLCEITRQSYFDYALIHYHNHQHLPHYHFTHSTQLPSDFVATPIYQTVNDALVERHAKGSDFINFIYHNSHTSNAQIMKSIDTMALDDLFIPYKSHNVLTLLTAQNRCAEVILHFLKKPGALQKVNEKMPEFVKTLIKKTENFDTILKVFPQLLSATDHNGDNALMWCSKYHHIDLLPQLIELASDEALFHQNKQGLNLLDFIRLHKNTPASDQEEALAYVERCLAKRLTPATPPHSTKKNKI